MNIIIPMAGMGKRMRPHTLTVPKPLIPIAGKPIVHRLVDDIIKVCDESVENIGFVINPTFGDEIESSLLEIAKSKNARGHIFYQDEALGTAHAIYCARDILEGKTIVAFADTLFKATFKLGTEKDALIWVQKVEDPSAFGVIKTDKNNNITAFVEKPQAFVSDLAIIGIYYFKKGEDLRREIKNLIDNKLIDNNEYQLTRALEAMRASDTIFSFARVDEWLDCGNKNATVNTNQRYLTYLSKEELSYKKTCLDNSIIIEPCYIGKDVSIKNSVIGPFVSVGDSCKINDSRIENSIIQNNSMIDGAMFSNSMIGNHAKVTVARRDLSISDYSIMNN